MQNELNSLCVKCTKNCKQDARAVILECKRYKPKPVQLELKFKADKKKG